MFQAISSRLQPILIDFCPPSWYLVEVSEHYEPIPEIYSEDLAKALKWTR